MPYHIAYAVKADCIDTISDAIEASTQFERERHESSYLGVNDLFRIPEFVIVKHNVVEEENEWDYPEHKDRNVLAIAEQTDGPDHVANLMATVGVDAVLVERKKCSSDRVQCSDNKAIHAEHAKSRFGNGCLSPRAW
jgi:hypothetical protein